MVRLKKEHIELVREKRNLSFVQDKMIYQKRISRWKQRSWFKSINNKFNFYFLINYQGQFIGLINGKDIDFDLRTCEGGIFLWEKEYWNTHVPVMASIILNDFNFLLANFKINYARVLKSNKNAVKYNLIQGYRVVEEKADGSLWMALTKDDYRLKSKKIKKALAIISKDAEPLSRKDISFEDDDEKTMKLLYSNLPKDIQELVEKIKLNDC